MSTRLTKALRRAAHQPTVSVPLARRARPCWCGRVAVAGELECAEHDGPILATAQAPSDPLTPGGVFDRQYP